jgi:hypothetical protein
MNSTFTAVASAMRQKPVLSHAQRVTRLYRSALRVLDSWIMDRDLWCEEAAAIRQQFDANKHHPADSGCVAAACLRRVWCVCLHCLRFLLPLLQSPSPWLCCRCGRGALCPLCHPRFFGGVRLSPRPASMLPASHPAAFLHWRRSYCCAACAASGG